MSVTTATALVRLVGGDDGFTAALADHCPPLARIDSTACIPIAGRPRRRISPSASGGTDAHSDCARDLPGVPRGDERSPARRYRYPFINCTHCGPRLTIIRAMPYDRPFTAMAPFPLCSLVRRNSAILPIAVFTPSRWPALTAGRDWNGGQRKRGEAALQAAIARLARATSWIKGIGGFHLACDAGNPAAVATLRRENTARQNRWR